MPWPSGLMAVELTPPRDIFPVHGIRLGSAELGGRATPRDDLVLLEMCPGSRVAATFTSNAFCAAPVMVCREHLGKAGPRYLVVNAGNANAGTGDDGKRAARECCAIAAELGACAAEQVLPFSTGVIGEPLEVERFRLALPNAAGALRSDGWLAAAHAIMTTDTVAKCVSKRFQYGDRTCTLTGMAKGSGMIRPNMATMLAFLATDAPLSQARLDASLSAAVERTFNRVTVDGDTSTNDSCVLIATGEPATAEESSCSDFVQALESVCEALAHALIRDAEGATKFITVEVAHGSTQSECLQVADAIAHSPLVKTAMFASDANWGRILAAVGRAGVMNFDVSRVRISINGVAIVENGQRAGSYTEEQGQLAMAPTEIHILVDLARGDEAATMWTCDFSHDYVTINAEYRT